MSDDKERSGRDTREDKVTTQRAKREYERQGYMPPQLSVIPKEVENRFLEEGYNLRWLRFCDPDGRIDGNYILQRKQEGYEFVAPSECPELNLFDIVADAKLGDIITQKDLALAKIPVYLAEERQEYFENQARMKEGTFIRDYKRTANAKGSYAIDDSVSETQDYHITAPRSKSD